MTNILAQAVSAGPPAAQKRNPKTCAWPDGHATSCLARTHLLCQHSSYRVLLPRDNGTRDRIKTMMVMALLITMVIVILARTSLPATESSTGTVALLGLLDLPMTPSALATRSVSQSLIPRTTMTLKGGGHGLGIWPCW